MSGRDMNALAQGLDEGTEYDYLQARIGQVEFLGNKLIKYGVPIQKPVRGHVVFVDVNKLFENMPSEHYPAQSLCIELYKEAGIRSVEIGTLLADRDPKTGENRYPKNEFLRLAIPRRVYTNNHMEYVAAAIRNIYKNREKYTKGYQITYEASILRHFTVELDPVK